MSFYTSLSGLKAAQTDLGTVSNNVANVSSYGFKKSRAEFGDIMTTARNAPGQGTRLQGIQQQFTQGGFESTSRELDLAIAGQGFLVTRDSLTGGNTQFTRNGSLSIDANRYLTDSAGGYVQVMPVDANGNITAGGLSSTQNLQLPLTNGVPRPTTKITLGVGLPSSADIPADRAAYTSAKPYSFDRLDPNSYNYSSQTTVYDSAGKAIPATLYFTRTTSTIKGDATNSWQARLFVGDKQVSADPASSTPTPLTLTFDKNGAITSPTGPVAFGSTFPTGASAPLNLTLDFGAATNQSTGTFTMGSVEQDGFSAGKLNDVAIGKDGLVTATFSDGTTQALGKVAIANFSNPSGLRQKGDAHWTVTGDSGAAEIGQAGTDGFGSIQSGALERANVDITEELVSLISAQRNFQANAKAIETSNTMTTAILNLRS